MKTMENNKFMMTFFGSFMYFFGLGSNPMSDIIEERRKTSDTERLAGDWNKIAGDIDNSYKKLCNG